MENEERRLQALNAEIAKLEARLKAAKDERKNNPFFRKWQGEKAWETKRARGGISLKTNVGHGPRWRRKPKTDEERAAGKQQAARAWDVIRRAAKAQSVDRMGTTEQAERPASAELE